MAKSKNTSENIDQVSIPATDEQKATAPKQKNSLNFDQSLLATVTLSIISLGALVVSIYQTRVLSLQQEVMAEQQRIMTESAKAQLWPNVAIGRNRGYEEGVINTLKFVVVNSGTGPAIIEGMSVQYEGKYAYDWGDLFNLTSLSDTVPVVANTASIIGGVLPAGESITILGLSENQPLMEHMARVIEEEGFIINICYKSVFDDHWLREHKFGQHGIDQITSVDSCAIADSVAFISTL